MLTVTRGVCTVNQVRNKVDKEWIEMITEPTRVRFTPCAPGFNVFTGRHLLGWVVKDVLTGEWDAFKVAGGKLTKLGRVPHRQAAVRLLLDARAA